MKNTLRKIFSPVLDLFESGDGVYAYKKSHRNILIVVGALFLLLSLISLYSTIKTSEPGGLIPGIVFLVVGAVCEVVGFLGSDQAVAKIWKSK